VGQDRVPRLELERDLDQRQAQAEAAHDTQRGPAELPCQPRAETARAANARRQKASKQDQFDHERGVEARQSAVLAERRTHEFERQQQKGRTYQQRYAESKPRLALDQRRPHHEGQPITP